MTRPVAPHESPSEDDASRPKKLPPTLYMAFATAPIVLAMLTLVGLWLYQRAAGTGEWATNIGLDAPGRIALVYTSTPPAELVHRLEAALGNGAELIEAPFDDGSIDVPVGVDGAYVVFDTEEGLEHLGVLITRLRAVLGEGDLVAIQIADARMASPVIALVEERGFALDKRVAAPQGLILVHSVVQR